MIIYVDIYMLKNVIFNFLLIYLTSLIIRKKFKIYRGIIASIIGGVYAICALYSTAVFDSSILKILISVVMLIVTFGKKEISIILSSFFVLTYLVAGLITSILNVNSQMVLIIFELTMIYVFHIYKQNQKRNSFYELHIQILEKEMEVIAKLDTGNELRDSIFGDSVIIVSEEKVNAVVDEELIKILNNEIFEIPDIYINKIKLISFKTISEVGMKNGIKVKTIINCENKKIESKAVMILTKNKFKGYDALIGCELLEGGYEYEDNCINKIKDKGIV